VLERLAASPVDEVVVVAGAYELEELAGARLVDCPDWERGPGASLRCGLAALGEEAEAAVIVLADGPDLAPAAVERVLAAWRSGDPARVLAASYGGERGHPLVLGRSRFGTVPDGGLRDAAVELVPCDDLGAPGDVDRPEDLPSHFRDGV
jgi:CTP:molybdopterin cytidylyltransferase MocA